MAGSLRGGAVAEPAPIVPSLIIATCALAAVVVAVALDACVSPGASVLFIVAVFIIGLKIIWS